MADENAPLLVVNVNQQEDAISVISVSTVTTLDDDDNYQSILQAIKHVKERVWVVAVYTLIACLASVLVGMLLGFPGTIGLELNDIYKSGHEHGIKDQSTEASLFGVRSFLRFAIRGVRNVYWMFLFPYAGIWTSWCTPWGSHSLATFRPSRSKASTDVGWNSHPYWMVDDCLCPLC